MRYILHQSGISILIQIKQKSHKLKTVEQCNLRHEQYSTIPFKITNYSYERSKNKLILFEEKKKIWKISLHFKCQLT